MALPVHVFSAFDISLLWAGVAAFAIGYLFGSIPFGPILTRLAGLGDLRSVGSGNIGATNVLRTGHKGLAAATLVGDALKGTLAVALVSYEWNRQLALLAGIAAFCGHLLPIWLGFRGGKGVATYVGVLLALAWQAALVFGAIWLLVVAVTRYSSVAALIASAAVPPTLWALGDRHTAGVFMLLSVLLWIKHRTNIIQLLNGTERRIETGSDARKTSGTNALRSNNNSAC